MDGKSERCFDDPSVVSFLESMLPSMRRLWHLDFAAAAASKVPHKSLISDANVESCRHD